MSAEDFLSVGTLALGLAGLHQAAWFLVQRRARPQPDARRGKSATVSLLSAAGAICVMLAGLAMLGVMVGAEQASEFDGGVDSVIERLRVPALIALFSWFTLIANTETLVAIFLFATGALWWRGMRAEAALVGVVWFGAYSTTWVLKHVVERPRPEFVFDVFAYTPSFPSAHAAGSISLFGILAYLAVRREARLRQRFEFAFWTVAAIALVSFSRTFITVHHASDVLGGLLLGGSWLLGGIAVAQRVGLGPDPKEPNSA